MSPENNIAAGIVTFNPVIERLLENINAVIQQVERVYIFDNGSSNISEIEKSTKKIEKISLIISTRNEGIAYALNRLFSKAQSDGFDWLLTLDQDSICHPDLINSYNKHLNEGDSFTTLRKDINYISDGTEDFGLREVELCITSGNLVKIGAWADIHGFNERLFIDMVDIDFCFRLRAKGYRIIKLGFYGLLHEMGDGTHLNLFGKSIYIGNYNAFRKYYIARNMVYVIRKYHLHNHYYSYKRLLILFFHALLFESDKINRCNRFLLGFVDGFKQFNYIDQFFEQLE